MFGERQPLCLGIAGGSGSGKSWLADFLKERLGPRAVVVSQDWYYRDNGKVSAAKSRSLNFDHPRSLETSLLREQLARLLSGRSVRTPRYDYASHARLKKTVSVEPAAVVILEGLWVLQDKSLREHLDFSVFISVPSDLRLVRRIRRDVAQRRVDLDETLRLYENFVRPMHERFIEPSAEHATWVWRQLEDAKFPSDLLSTIENKLASLAGPARR